eukprot:c22475_g1_i1 orf=105-425(-)
MPSSLLRTYTKESLSASQAATAIHAAKPLFLKFPIHFEQVTLHYWKYYSNDSTYRYVDRLQMLSSMVVTKYDFCIIPRHHITIWFLPLFLVNMLFPYLACFSRQGI